MKRMSMNKSGLARWMIVGFLFSMCGVLMQIIAPEIPGDATVMGIVFFVLMLVFGAAILKLRAAIREEKLAAAKEQNRREREQRAA